MRILRAAAAALLAGVLLSATPAAHAADTGVISGAVTMPPGLPLDVKVEAWHVGGARQGVAVAVSGSTGTFSIPALPAGTYRLAFLEHTNDHQAFNRGGRWYSGDGVSALGKCTGTAVDACTNAATITIPEGGAKNVGTIDLLKEPDFFQRTASGRVTVPAGRSTEDVSVEVWWRDGEGSWRQAAPSQHAYLGETGQYSVQVTQTYYPRYALVFRDDNGTFARPSFADGIPWASSLPPINDAVGIRSVDLSSNARGPIDLGTSHLKLPTTLMSGGVSLPSTAKWGETVTGTVDTVWGSGSDTEYQWFAETWDGDVQPIPGATTRSLPTDVDPVAEGSKLYLRASPAGDHGLDHQVVEDSVEVVNADAATYLSGVRVNGLPRVGQVLTAAKGSWAPRNSAFSYSYQWRRNGVAIPGATAATYRVALADFGRPISVDVTAADGNGWQPFAATTQASAPVTAQTVSTLAMGVSKASKKRTKITVSVRALGKPSTGWVQLKRGSTVIKTVKLYRGTASWTGRIKKGTHRITAVHVRPPANVVVGPVVARTWKVKK